MKNGESKEFDFDLVDFSFEGVHEDYDPGRDEDGNLDLSDKLFKKFAEKNMQIIKKVEDWSAGQE